MGRHALFHARRRPRMGVLVGAVSAAALVFVGADTPPGGDGCCEAAAPASAPAPVSVSLAAAPVARPIVPATLSPGVAEEDGLQVDTIRVARAVSAEFPEILSIGGVRSDPLKWHPHGLAIDVMIPGARSAAGIALGDSVLHYVMANAERFGVHHVIWRQTIYKPDGSARRMADRGSDTANHYDHVHVATKGGGYPRQGQVFLR
ncbi:hypothetical protein [Mycolicibacterium hassiacum]|uniref:hypothetical protein n=1 Tax=Mycolicibacterium hassiacum TaxID=46351 RepID=UPI001558D1CF|nr:hypothetical protein [Mycolicibacterium hassiacum]MBX5486344.1 hypothetical protein [Mycolicibacterium hassiacum]